MFESHIKHDEDFAVTSSAPCVLDVGRIKTLIEIHPSSMRLGLGEGGGGSKVLTERVQVAHRCSC